MNETGRVFVATWGDGLFILKRDSNRLDPVPFELPSKKVRTVLQDTLEHLLAFKCF